MARLDEIQPCLDAIAEVLQSFSTAYHPEAEMNPAHLCAALASLIVIRMDQYFDAPEQDVFLQSVVDNIFTGAQEQYAVIQKCRATKALPITPPEHDFTVH